jgi:hypothetical protein
MSQSKKLQIPLSSKLKEAFRKKTEEYGFSSANEALRLLIHNFVNGQIVLSFNAQDNTIPALDLRSERRLARNIAEIRKGKVKVIDYSKNRNALKDLLS